MHMRPDGTEGGCLVEGPLLHSLGVSAAGGAGATRLAGLLVGDTAVAAAVVGSVDYHYTHPVSQLSVHNCSADAECVAVIYYVATHAHNAADAPGLTVEAVHTVALHDSGNAGGIAGQNTKDCLLLSHLECHILAHSNCVQGASSGLVGGIQCCVHHHCHCISDHTLVVVVAAAAAVDGGYGVCAAAPAAAGIGGGHYWRTLVEEEHLGQKASALSLDYQVFQSYSSD